MFAEVKVLVCKARKSTLVRRQLTCEQPGLKIEEYQWK